MGYSTQPAVQPYSKCQKHKLSSSSFFDYKYRWLSHNSWTSAVMASFQSLPADKVGSASDRLWISIWCFSSSSLPLTSLWKRSTFSSVCKCTPSSDILCLRDATSCSTPRRRRAPFSLSRSRVRTCLVRSSMVYEGKFKKSSLHYSVFQVPLDAPHSLSICMDSWNTWV